MADIGFGTYIQRVTTSTAGDVFTSVAALHDLSGPSITRDDVEVTTYDSADRYREYIPGLREGGEITGLVNWLSTNATLQDLYHSTEAQSTAGPASSTNAVQGSFESSGLETYRILGPNLDFWRFDGYVKGITQAQPIGDRRTLEITWKISGRPVLGHASST